MLTPSSNSDVGHSIEALIATRAAICVANSAPRIAPAAMQHEPHRTRSLRRQGIPSQWSRWNNYSADISPP